MTADDNNLDRSDIEQVDVAWNRDPEAPRSVPDKIEGQPIHNEAELACLRKDFDSLHFAIAHNLSAPLRAILGFARAIQDDDAAHLGAGGGNALERIVANGERMTAMIAGLLEMSRLVQAEFSPVQVDLTELAAKVFAQLRADAPQRAVSVELQRQLGAYGDATLLQQLLKRLIENAWKFTQNRDVARIKFGCSIDKGGRTVFFVSDNGTGFGMDFADRLFGLFQRLHSAEDFPGIGMGLAISRSLVSRHGGDIWAEAKPGQGATFFFTLPARY